MNRIERSPFSGVAPTHALVYVLVDGDALVFPPAEAPRRNGDAGAMRERVTFAPTHASLPPGSPSVLSSDDAGGG